MNHFPNTFLGGVAVAIGVHLVATWLYHRGRDVILSPISAAWRASVERAREKHDREVAALRNSKEDLILATVRDVRSTIRVLGLSGTAIVCLLLAALIDFLAKHFPSELGTGPNPTVTVFMAVVAGLLAWFLAYFEFMRSSSARDVLVAASKPPANQPSE
jgi:hypothetical protein